MSSLILNSTVVKKHKWFPITKFNPGTLVKYEQIPLFNSIPSNIDYFRGRQQEMCEVISMLHENRLVNILGPPGIGKTSIARQLCNHLKARKKFYDGILYINLRGCESGQMFLTRLCLLIETVLQSNDLNKNSDNLAMLKQDSKEDDNFLLNEK